MNVDGRKHRTIWLNEDGWSVQIIDQTLLPFVFEIRRLTSLDDILDAIRTLKVRGTSLVGAAAAYGLCLALREDPGNETLESAIAALLESRPGLLTLKWALTRMRQRLGALSPDLRVQTAYSLAGQICDEDIAINMAIGMHGMEVIAEVGRRKRPGQPINILTHCNAGWLSTVDWGTATAAIYMCHDGGLPIHVWVDETRPRLQGSFLTAWELSQHGVAHTVITDNAGGQLMQQGEVDLILTGCHRATASGDVCNTIGTYLKAAAARDCDIPVYVALASPSIDFALDDGLTEIPIEERRHEEVSRIAGRNSAGLMDTIAITAEGSYLANPAFDVTPARLLNGLITERGVIAASRQAITEAFPERVSAPV